MIAKNEGSNGSSREAAEIRAEIDRAREQIATSVLELRHQMALSTDWHVWYRRRPGIFLGVAFAVGLYFGTRKLPVIG